MLLIILSAFLFSMDSSADPAAFLIILIDAVLNASVPDFLGW